MTLASIIMVGMFVWVGVALFGIGIILDTMTMPFHPPGAGFDENGDTMGMPALQNTVMYVMLPVFVLLQVALAWRVMQYVDGTAISTTMVGILPFQTGITGLELVVAAASTGIFAGIGIIYGH
ncbi:MAG: fatty acid desaturase, partial [Piscirickettsiaceae bacterium]|nr:fatty acid desaturase [Piscirickettsiaceae bacterium]